MRGFLGSRELFERDGFIVLPGFVSTVEVDRILGEVERYVRDVVPGMPPEEVYYEDRGDPSLLKQLQRLSSHDSFFEELGQRGAIPRLAESLLGEPVLLRNLQYFDKPASRSRPTPPHQDGFYFPITPNRAVTLWMALDDVGEEQGCVRYLRGSHLGGLRSHEESGVLGFSRSIRRPEELEQAEEVAVPCRAGDLIAHHSMTIHRAEENRSPDRSRRALGFVYFAASVEVDEEQASAYQARLDRELRAAGRI